MVRTVWFCPWGRTGNNIVQYCAAEVIRHIFQFDNVQKIEGNPRNMLEIRDDKYKEIVENYMKYPSEYLECDRDIYLYGFFQYSSILVYLRPQLLSLFHESNHTNISHDNYTISQIISHKINNIITNEDVVIHLRLDDYIHDNNPPHIFDKEKLGELIDMLTFKKLYIVCDELRTEWEKKYVEYFKQKYNTILLSGSLLDDFTILRKAKRLITSPSTFCWIAAFLGEGEEVIIPYSDFYKGGQTLKECHEHSKVYYGIPFTTNLLS